MVAVLVKIVIIFQDLRRNLAKEPEVGLSILLRLAMVLEKNIGVKVDNYLKEAFGLLFL